MGLGRTEPPSSRTSGRQPQDGSCRRFPPAPTTLLFLAAAFLVHVSLSHAFGVGLRPASSQAPILPVAPCSLP